MNVDVIAVEMNRLVVSRENWNYGGVIMAIFSVKR